MKAQNLRLWFVAGVSAVANCHVLRPRILRPRDTTYSANIRDPTILAIFGIPGQTASVNSGVTYFISGQGPHNFFGNLINSGSIIVSQTDSLLGVGGIISTPLVVTYVGAGTVTTGGVVTDGVLVTNAGSLISLNDYGDTSLVSPSIYNWALYSMVNGGTMQWCGNGNPPTGSEFTLTCITNTCINNGLVTWEQYDAANGIAFFWTAGLNPSISSTSTIGFNPTNNGAFRLINTDLQITQDVLSTVSGGGCFVLGNNGLLSLLTGTQGLNANTKTFAGQSIYFTTTTAGLFISPAVYALNKNFGATLYGFGTGNYIAFTELLTITNPLTGTVPFSYSGSTLTVNFLSGTSIAINIGTGYTASSFSTVLGVSNLRIPTAVVSIRYGAAAPARTPPNVCVVTYPVCANPATTVTASFASTVATASSTSTSTRVSTSTSLTTSTSVSTSTASLTSTSVVTSTIVSTKTSTFITTSTAVITSTVDVTSTAVVTSTSSAVSISTSIIFSTIAATSAGNTGAFATITANVVGATVAETYTVPPSGTMPGTVIVLSPTNNNFKTSTIPYTGTHIYTSATTISTIQPSGTAPGVIYVSLVDAVLVTTTRPYSGSITVTNTVAPSNGVQGTIEVLTPTTSLPPSLTTTIGSNRCMCIPRNSCRAQR